MTSKGKLYIVSTPIGNMEDITFRAVRILKEVDLIAAEDTRKTKRLLSRFKISRPLTSYYSYNEREKAHKLTGKLEQGMNIALVSEAGSPGISDPSYQIIQLALETGIAVIPVPGTNAAITAAAVSGLRINRFTFEGFLPKKKGKRKKRLQRFLNDDITFIIYESPFRVKNTLEDIYNILGNRKIALARELTKLHEEIIRGSILDIIKEIENRKKLGEVTVVVEGEG